MTRGWFHQRLASGRQTWLGRATFIGGAFALAFAATTHSHPGEAEAQTRTVEARAEEDDYIITLSSAGTYTAGKQGTLTMKLVPKPTFRVDRDFPTKIVMADPPGVHVALTKKKLEKSDGTFTDTSAVFTIPFTSSKAGKATIGGKFHFQVCAAKCNTHNVDLELTVEVDKAAP